MKVHRKKSSKLTLSDKIADALTVKPKPDIEEDQVFGTKPTTLSRQDYNSSESEDETAISDFRKRNVNLLSEISKKYEGKIVSQQQLMKDNSDDIDDSSDDNNDKVNDFSKGSLKIDYIDTESEDDKPTGKNENIPSDSKYLDNEGNYPSTLRTVSGSEYADSDEGESDDYSIVKRQIQGEDEVSDDGSENEEDGSDSDEEGYDISAMDEPVKENFEHMKPKNVSEEEKKGICVRNQLLIWEGLLEMRIHLQRCMTTANQMPMSETYEELKQNNQFLEESDMTKANVITVLEKLLNLQNCLLRKFPETKDISSTKSNEAPIQQKQESDEEIPSDTDNEEIPSDTEDEETSVKIKDAPQKENVSQSKKRKLQDYEKELDKRHKSFKKFRDSTIQKFNDKTRLATASGIKNAPTNTVLQQISYILSDRSKLTKRTQLKRSEYDIVGYKNKPEEEKVEDLESNPVTRDRKDADEYIPEIFDDSDFYHQLLRELIECKSADISDPVQLSRQWIALQQMRSKMKRKVDTKATKGRKIKYVVHNQLVNYMAPEKNAEWTEESTNELYSSLFGKLFEQNSSGLNFNLENGLKIMK